MNVFVLYKMATLLWAKKEGKKIRQLNNIKRKCMTSETFFVALICNNKKVVCTRTTFSLSTNQDKVQLSQFCTDFSAIK